MPVRFRSSALLASAFIFAACAGGHGNSAFTPGGLSPAGLSHMHDAVEPSVGTKVAMTFSVLVPKVKTTAGETDAQRHEWFVASNTQSIQLRIYKAKSKHTKANLLGSNVFSLSRGAKGCVTSAKGRTCTQTLNLPPPSVDIVASTYDKKPAGKTIPKSAKQLAADDIVGQTVKAGKKIALVLGGIPVTFTMTLPGSMLVNGVQTASLYGMGQGNVNIGIQAFDADGNMIVTDGYVDAAGAPTGIAMKLAYPPASCTAPLLQDDRATPGKSITVGAPPQDGVFFNYGATNIAAVFTTPGYCTFSVSATFGKSVQTGAIVLDGPLLSEYTIPATNANPRSIIVASNSTIVFTDLNNSVGTIDVASKAITEYPLDTLATGGVASSGGGLWVSGYGKLFQLSTSGTLINTFTTTTTGQPSDQLAVDAGGNFWFTESEPHEPNKVAQVTPTGATTEYTAGNGQYALGITNGPASNGDMWFTGCPGNVVVSIVPNGSSVGTQTPYVVPNGPNGAPAPQMIVTGPDGNLWFASCGAGTISYMPVPSGGTPNPTAFAVPTTQTDGRGQVWGLAPGPNGDMWGGNIADNQLDRIPIGATSVSAIATVNVSASPWWMVAGPDGAIWFTESTRGTSIPPNGKIGRLFP
jgi:streptogramin lyase